MTNDGIKTLEAYFGLMNTNGAAHIFRAALELGILDALKEHPLDAAAIAKTCGTIERATSLMLDVLVVLGLVQPHDGCYALTPLAGFLLAGSYRHLGDEYWAHLPVFLRSGEPLTRMDAPEQSEKFYQAQAAALAWMLRPAAELAARVLSIGQKRKNLKILDIGAGAAVWSLAMARRDPGTTVTAVDWPAVLKVAAGAAREACLSDRFSTIPGNFHEITLPADTYDLAVVGNVTHLETPDGNAALFAKLNGALKPTGELVIFDIFSGQPRGDLNRTLYTLGLALRTEHGRVHTPEELNSMLGRAGFSPGRIDGIEVPPYAVGMLLTRKSAQLNRSAPDRGSEASEPALSEVHGHQEFGV